MIQSVNKYHIYEIFASDGKFYYSIPKYQREYTWSYREWDALYDDISENNPEYFIGSIICKLAESAMTQETWTDLWARTQKNVYVWTIEHIFPEGENIPQCWIDMIADGDADLARKYLNEYTHKIGNLTITGYNSTLGNKSFSEKRDRKSKDGKRFIGYKNGLEINNEIAKLDAWTIENIKNRSETLIQQLMDMFKFPGLFPLCLGSCKLQERHKRN